MAAWNKYGLDSPRLWRSRGGEPRYSSLPRATRFRLALEEQGGLFALYGLYLAGRADLLPSPHLQQLRKIKPHRKPCARHLAGRELGDSVADIRFLRVSPGADVFVGRCRGGAVVVEAYSPETREIKDKDWADFRKDMKRLEEGPETRSTRDRPLEHFREWLSLAGDLDRRRTILSNLRDLPSGCITQFPRLIPDLQSPSCLVYEGSDATPLAEAVRSETEAAKKSLQLLVEALLEQSLLLSLLDAEGRLENYASLPEGRFGFLSLPVLAPIPVEWTYELLQYMASTIAGQSPRALHMLARMSSKHDPYAGEQRLMRELSGLQPELKINIIAPESVTSLENAWRALANTELKPPLFLELFHRQWTIVGQYSGEAAPDSDLIAQSLWPVLGRILRYRAGAMLTPEKGRELAANSGLLLLTAFRQAGMLLEQIRDNDIAVIVDRQEDDPSDARLNRRTVALVRSTLALAVFLLSVYLAFEMRGEVVKIAAGATAAISAAVLALFVARID